MIAPRRPMVTAPPQAAPRPAGEISVLRYALAFVLPLTTLVQIQVVGTLFLHDFLTPIVLVSLLVTERSKVSLRPLQTLFWLLGLWLLGQILTDLVVQSEFEDYARGWLRIVLFAANILMLWLLSKGRMGVLAFYLAGTGIATALTPAIVEDSLGQIDPWKFGIGGGLALITVAVCEWRGLRQAIGQYSPAFLLAFLGLVSLWNNSRSLFAIMALSAAYFGLAKLVSGHPELKRRVNPISFGLVALAGVASSQALTLAYESAASSGVLGDAAYRKYAEQAQADVNLLVGGRPELLVSLQAIADRPILGHGSWAKDPYYVILQAQRMIEVGLRPNVEYYLNAFGALIPTHSHLLGSWVEAGILGALPWLWALALSVLALYRSLKVGGVPSAMVVLTAFTLFWDILFSPFGASARFLKAAQICILLVATRTLRPVLLLPSRQPVAATRAVRPIASAPTTSPRQR